MRFWGLFVNMFLYGKKEEVQVEGFWEVKKGKINDSLVEALRAQDFCLMPFYIFEFVFLVL